MDRWLVSAVLGAALAVASGAGAREAQFRIGALFPRAEGAFWDSTFDAFTLERSDLDDAFGSVAWLEDLGPNVAIGPEVGYYEAKEWSAVRGTSDRWGDGVFHDTTYSVLPFTANVQVFLGRTETRSDGSECRGVGVYAGGGIGGLYWRFEEEGEFVDFVREEIVYDRFVDSGVALAVQAFAGFTMPLGESWSLVADARWIWAEDELDDDYAGFGDIDLSGLAVTGGVGFRF